MSVSLAIWLSVCSATLIALAATWQCGLGEVRKFVRVYLLAALAEDCATHFTLLKFGYRSAEYKYVYYGADLAVVIVGFFVLARLVELAFEKSSLKLTGIRAGAIAVFTGLAVCSCVIVYMLRGQLSTGSLGLELEQNFSFLGMVLAVILFAMINIVQVEGVRFRRLVLSISLLYGSGAIIYSLTAIIPQFRAVATYAVPMSSLAGLLLIAYSLWVPEPEMARAAELAAGRAEVAA